MKKNFLFAALAAMAVTATVFTGCKDSEPDPVKVSSVEFKASPDALEIDGTFTFEVTVLPENADNKSVVWDSSDKTVATVADGVVKALAAGKTTISATAADGSGKKDEFEVTVNVASVVTVTGNGLGEERLEIKASKAMSETPDPVKVAIAAPRGIENFKVQITSSSAVFMGALTGMNLNTEFDLANPGALGDILSSPAVGLVNGDAVKGKSELEFNITHFMPMIFGIRMEAGEAGDCTADFKLTVTDTKGTTDTQTLKLSLINDIPAQP
jgi:hypothetical protein